MTKENVITAVAAEAGVTKRVAEEVIEALLNTVTRSLSGGEKVQLSGFGTFEVKCRGARVGRNIRENKQVYIPAKKVPCFRPGKRLLEFF